MLGRVPVEVHNQGTVKTLPLVVVEGSELLLGLLLGCDWLQKLAMGDQLVNRVGSGPPLQLVELLGEKNLVVFKNELGTRAKIYVDREAQPRFYKPRPVPYAVKPLMEREI